MTEVASQMPSMVRSVDAILAQRRKLKQMLDTMPYRQEIIPIEEIRQLRGVKKLISEATQSQDSQMAGWQLIFSGQDDASRETLSKIKQTIEDLEMKKIMAKLDRCPVFVYKFATGEYEEHQEGFDSIYYMTKSGVTLRLKFRLRGQGVQEICRPFKEKIAFYNQRDEASFEPSLKCGVEEWVTQKFMEMLDDEKMQKSWQSEIKIYNVEGQTLIRPPGRSGDKHHEGHPVNKIFYGPKSSEK